MFYTFYRCQLSVNTWSAVNCASAWRFVAISSCFIYSRVKAYLKFSMAMHEPPVGQPTIYHR